MLTNGQRCDTIRVSKCNTKRKKDTTMKNTMKDIANKYYYIDIVDLWDEIAERKNMRKATEEEVAEVFAHEYNVDVTEVMEYFL